MGGSPSLGLAPFASKLGIQGIFQIRAPRKQLPSFGNLPPKLSGASIRNQIIQWGRRMNVIAKDRLEL